jgi:hypothetical protein
VKINNRRDILLLLLYSPGKSSEPNQPIVGRTRLVKMLFLFKEEALKEFRKGTEINEDNFYDFFAWSFGPFSSQVYDDLKFFELRGFIETNESGEDTLPESAAEWEMWLSSSLPEATDYSYTEYQEEQFQLTERGVRFVEENLYDLLSRSQKNLIREFRKRMESSPLRAILSYVYKNYPKLTEKSEIREQIIG